MSFASDALLKQTVAKVAALEKMVAALKAHLDQVPVQRRTLTLPKQQAG